MQFRLSSQHVPAEPDHNQRHPHLELRAPLETRIVGTRYYRNKIKEHDLASLDWLSRRLRPRGTEARFHPPHELLVRDPSSRSCNRRRQVESTNARCSRTMPWPRLTIRPQICIDLSKTHHTSKATTSNTEAKRVSCGMWKLRQGRSNLFPQDSPHGTGLHFIHSK